MRDTPPPVDFALMQYHPAFFRDAIKHSAGADTSPPCCRDTYCMTLAYASPICICVCIRLVCISHGELTERSLSRSSHQSSPPQPYTYFSIVVLRHITSSHSTLDSISSCQDSSFRRPRNVHTEYGDRRSFLYAAFSPYSASKPHPGSFPACPYTLLLVLETPTPCRYSRKVSVEDDLQAFFGTSPEKRG